MEYKCRYCGKICSNPGSLARHEKACKENPDAVHIVMTTEQRKRISERTKEAMNTDAVKQNIHNGLVTKWKDESYRNKITNAIQKSHSTPEFKQRMSEIKNKNYEDNPELKKIISESVKKLTPKPVSVEARLKRMNLNRHIHISNNKSKIEKLVFEMLLNRQNELNVDDIKNSYIINDKEFDFALFKNNKLEVLIDIDGEYNHGLLCDSDGVKVNNYRDCERFLHVPDNVKLIICDNNNSDNIIKEIIDTLNLDYNSWIENIIQSLPKEFPFPVYDDARMIKDFNRLVKYNDISLKSRICDSIIRNYHKSIYKAHVKNKISPFDAWNNPDMLRLCVENRFIYTNKFSSHKIVDGFNICKLAPKVSVFSASVAKHIITTYLNEFDVITDPFSGFSGRMIGTLASGKHYIGYDINKDHVKESCDINTFLYNNNLIKNNQAEITVKDLFSTECTECECVFTCPPYGLKEQWNENETDMTCDAWIDEVMKHYKAKKYVFVVDETEKYKMYIKNVINNKYHFGQSNEYILVIE